MKILIVTKSFVREVSSFVKYASFSSSPYQFSLVMPYCHENLPARVATPSLVFPDIMRASFYGSPLLTQFKTFQPDIVHVFEEFSGLMALQCTLFRDIWCRQSKLLVYSAENLEQNVRPVLRKFAGSVLNRADTAFVCSSEVKRVLEKEGFSKPIEIFPLGVEPELFCQRSVDHLKRELKLDGKFVIGYVGRLLEMKGVFLLLKALNCLPEDVHLLMIGAGPAGKQLREQAEAENLQERLHLIGQMPYSELPSYINCMHVGVIPSQTTPRWKEQFGRSIVEMMSCSVPVIGSDSGSIPEIIGDAGYIFHENNVKELIDIVNRLREQPEVCYTLARQGRKRFQTNYSTEIMNRQFLSIYRQLLKL